MELIAQTDSGRRLLILACSQSKRAEPGTMPAIERYDGPAFRVVRRYLRQFNDNGLSIYILSARFGLVDANTPLPNYDQKMDLAQATAMTPSISRAYSVLATGLPPSQIMVCAGRIYLSALGGSRDDRLKCVIAPGGQGKRLTALKAWLLGPLPKDTKK